MKIHLLIPALLLAAGSAQAECPSSPAGTYSGYGVLDSGDDPLGSAHSKRIKVMTLFHHGKGRVQRYFRVDAGNPIGLQEHAPTDIGYSFDRKTCTLRIWKASAGPSAADLGFAMADSGRTLFGIGQSPDGDTGKFRQDTNFYLYTRQ